MSSHSQSVGLTEEEIRQGGTEFNPEELEQQFEFFDAEQFHVEYTEKGDDIVYHFWPPGDHASFIEGFAKHLEEAFQRVLPSDQEVLADWTSLREATVQHAHGAGMVPRKDAEKTIVLPRETYYVRVVDGLKNPLSDVFLKGRVFETLKAVIKENA